MVDASVAQRSKPAAAQPILRLERVGKRFIGGSQELTALADVSLEILPRQFVAFVGPSGCGKTTLLSILGLLDVPSEGEYWFDGDRTSLLGTRDRALLRSRRLGFVFQNFNLISDLTALENVALPLKYQGLRGSECKDRAAAALDRVAMSDRATHYPAQLSGGQQQRTALARAIVSGPSVVLADEPTGNLDSKTGDAVMELLMGLRDAGAAICLVTHDPRCAQSADRVVHLFDSRITSDESNA